jgi:type IV pilus assembly protein PilC
MAKQNKPSRPLHLPFKEREYFTENLALLMKSGVAIGEALDSLLSGVRTRSFKKAIVALKADIDTGYGLGEALQRSRIVGDQTLALVKMGEVSGNLVENLKIAAVQEAKRYQFRSKLRSALVYPSFVIGLTIIIGLGVAWFLLPRLAQTFQQLRVALPPISQAMINFGLFLKEHGVVAVPAFFAGAALFLYILFAAPGTKNIGRKLMLSTPGIGRLIREIELAQFGYLLGTLMDAGLPVTQSLQLLAETSTTPDYQKLYRYLADSIDNGDTFRESLGRRKHATKLLPSSVQQMIIAGERSGSLPEVLATIGKTYEAKSDTTTQNLESIVEPILLVVVAGGVLLVAVAVILPIYSLIGGLNQ